MVAKGHSLASGTVWQAEILKLKLSACGETTTSSLLYVALYDPDTAQVRSCVATLRAPKYVHDTKVCVDHSFAKHIERN